MPAHAPPRKCLWLIPIDSYFASSRRENSREPYNLQNEKKLATCVEFPNNLHRSNGSAPDHRTQYTLEETLNLHTINVLAQSVD